MFDIGSKPVRIVGGAISYYEEYTTTNAYVERPLGGAVNTVMFGNDSTTDIISISFDGATLEADMKHGETLTLNVQGRTSVYIRGAAGGGKVRFWCW